MKLVSAKCTNCGGILQVDSEKDAAICKFCQSAFIVDKAIENYNITNNYTTVNNINGQEVHIHSSESPEKLLENIKALLNRNEIRLAQNTLNRLKESYPTDYRIEEGSLIIFIKSIGGINNLSPDNFNSLSSLLNNLNAVNGDVYKEYHDSLISDCNAALGKFFGEEPKGNMLLVKLNLLANMSVLRVPSECMLRMIGYNAGKDGHLRLNVDRADSARWDSARDMLKAEIDKADDSDDEFLSALYFEIEKAVVMSRAWQPNSKYNAEILDKNYPRWREMKTRRETEMTKLENAVLSKLSADAKQNLERLEKEKRRVELENFWNRYAELLRNNGVKEAYKMLADNPETNGVKQELAKFKKGLSVKYLGDVGAFDVNETIANALGEEKP